MIVYLQLLKKSFKFFSTNRQIRVNTNPNELEKYITISPIYLTAMLDSNLNINNIYEDMQNGKAILSYGEYSEEEYQEKLSNLKNIRNEKQLRRYFPWLYKTYKEMEKLKMSVDKVKNKSTFDYLLFIEENNLNKYDVEMIDSSSSFSKYIEYVSETFSILYEKKDELSKLALQDRMNSRVFGHSAAEHLELYVADRYAEMALDPDCDISKKQKCCYYLSAYIFENLENLDDRMIVERLITNIGGQEKKDTTTKREVYEKFKKILIDNPELFNINFDNHIFNDMTVDEIDSLMASYMKSLKVKWDIIPDGYDIVFEPYEKIKPDNAIDDKKHKKIKKDPSELFYKKKAFFDSSDPFIRILGKDTFDGYVGYIYPNGKVILDKFYEDSKTKKLAEEVAIYCMEIDDFYRLSQLSKSEIIRDRLCKRFYHRGDWQARVKQEISGNADSNINEKTYVLRQLSETNN